MNWKKLNSNIYKPLREGGFWVFSPSGHPPEASTWANIPVTPAEAHHPRARYEGWMVGFRAPAMNDVIPGLSRMDGYCAWDTDGNWVGYLPTPTRAVECLIRWRKHKPSYVKTGKAPWHLRLMERVIYGREL